MTEKCKGGKMFDERDSIEYTKEWAKKLIDDIQWVHKNVADIVKDKDDTPYDKMLESITKTIIAYRHLVMDEMRNKCECVKCEFSKTCFYSPIREKKEKHKERAEADTQPRGFSVTVREELEEPPEKIYIPKETIEAIHHAKKTEDAIHYLELFFGKDEVLKFGAEKVAIIISKIKGTLYTKTIKEVREVMKIKS
jgi:hypothetical protein